MALNGHGMLITLCLLILVRHVAATQTSADGGSVIAPQWTPEADTWNKRFAEAHLGNLSASSLPLAGLSMLFPDLVCTADSRVCHVTLGEGEINAAASAAALALSPSLDLGRTYFLLSGIAGVSPRQATVGGVALARFAVQVALQYELDARSLPNPDWPSGYFAYGRDRPLQYPCVTYGTEVFELNVGLRDAAFGFASRATLADADGPRQYRQKYGAAHSLAVEPPAIVKCDVATSDVYYSGTRLAEAFDNTTTLWTNGTGVYCMSAQEDNAVLEVLLRAAIQGLVDFGRIIVLRSGSNFDRPPPGLTDWQHLTANNQQGFDLALANMFNAGIQIVAGILANWNCSFAAGLAPDNYIGDIFGSLGGHPDFGLGSITDGRRVEPVQRRRYRQASDLAKREMGRRGQFGPRALRKM
ncbi:hypothetical protein CDD82_5692 [Ophiocordyceps australis]|uniref:Purine nucleoside permease n=1 Tax=Ophiocordyceps australis TaxID=1399860 RepID=A0A2C5Z115_9HYPO|nr:hypothetical protein CDD82_5692 [Ophiocordyceps australis]